MKKVLLPLLALLIVCSCKEEPKGKAPEKVIIKNKIITTTAKARIDSVLNAFVQSGNNAFGYADIALEKPMQRNTIVQIYSMTKPITGTALMTLFEQGKFKLDDPLSKYIPEFENMTVYAGVDKNGKMKTEPLKREISIRDLTRHTAGFPNRDDIPGLSKLFRKADAMNRENTLTQMAEKMAKVPLWFQPGAQWEYGPSVDVQALLVERISGIPYGEYVQQHVLSPLNMDETRYFIPKKDRDRFSKLYIRKGEGELVKDTTTYSNYTAHWPLTRGGSGLTSTLDDYMRFAQMLVKEGSLDSVQVLQPETVKLMATNHLPDSVTKRSWLPSKGQVGFGIDFAVRIAPPKTPNAIVALSRLDSGLNDHSITTGVSSLVNKLNEDSHASLPVVPLANTVLPLARSIS